MSESAESRGSWSSCYAVLGVVGDPEYFAAASCNAEVGRKVGEWSREMAWEGCGAGRRGSGEGRLRL